ncbi:hypothetical protein HDV02_002242 [Globomyces sp. JEL0801]|nr:hypothetical protein HDV02_002242 [Globomyces sp. JEL0801]
MYSIAFISLFISNTFAHAILDFPTPRKNGQMSFANPGIKVANFPITDAQKAGCLDSTPGAAVDTFTSGQDITVKWTITIPHKSDPGVRVAVQFPGEQFTVLQDNINVNDKSATLKLPAGKTSDKAVLQWFWATQEDGGFYMACSDIKIVGQAANAPAPAAPAPVANPDPAPVVNPAPAPVVNPAPVAANPVAKPADVPVVKPAPANGQGNAQQQNKANVVTVTQTVTVDCPAATN